MSDDLSDLAARVAALEVWRGDVDAAIDDLWRAATMPGGETVSARLAKRDAPAGPTAAAPLPPPAQPVPRPGPVADASAVTAPPCADAVVNAIHGLAWAAEEVDREADGLDLAERADALAAYATAQRERDARLARMLTGVADWWRDNQDSPKSALKHLERACRAAAAELDGTGGA